MAVKVRVYDDQVNAVALLLRGADKEITRQIRQHTRAIGEGEWRDAIRGGVMSRLDEVVMARTAKLLVSTSGVRLRAAATKRPLSGGLMPSYHWKSLEFGNWDGRTKTYKQHSRKGKQYTLTRHTARQLRPRVKSGYMAYPAAARLIPRFAALWTQTAIRTVYELIERK